MIVTLNFLSLCDLRNGAGLLLLLLDAPLLPNDEENVLVPAEAVPCAATVDSPNLLWLGLRNPGSHLRLRQTREYKHSAFQPFCPISHARP